ncbi:hypothetical protein FKM82_001952 [Ascaphus truei]
MRFLSLQVKGKISPGRTFTPAKREGNDYWCPDRMADLHFWEHTLPYLGTILTLLLHAAHSSPVTEQDIALLSGDPETPHCFTRTFLDLTCYWEDERMEDEKDDAESGSSYAFYYCYEGESEKECNITNITTESGNNTLYICQIPEKDLHLFSNLIVRVQDKHKNQTVYLRNFGVESVGLIDHPLDIKIFRTGVIGEFQATWKPPDNEFNSLFIYEVQYWPENSTQNHNQIVEIEKLTFSLVDLQSDLQYHLRVRTKPNEKDSLDGFWGPWSEVTTFFPPQSADNIGLQCFTFDLSQVCCNWNKTTEDPHSSQHLFYQYRGLEWQPCEAAINTTDCLCAFRARNGSAVSVVVNISSAARPVTTYYKAPFWITHVVLPPPPELEVTQLSGGKLALHWAAPMPGLEEDMIYQIRFLQDGSEAWKTLQVPHGVQHEVLDLIPGSHYTLQMRASPSGDRVQGFWSKWSPPNSIKLPPSTDWVVITAAVSSLLLVPGAVLCIRCISPSICRKLKDKLWPPLPNLHSVLDIFLNDIHKQYKPNSTLYEKPLEEATMPACLEILCEETLSTETQPPHQDYVQLSPPTYHNEDSCPKLSLLLLSPTLSTVTINQPNTGITNQSYLPIRWDQSAVNVQTTVLF